MDRGEREQCVPQMTQDSRVRLAFLDLILDGVEDRGEGAEVFIREAASEPPFQCFDPRYGLLVVFRGDVEHASLLGRWLLP